MRVFLFLVAMCGCDHFVQSLPPDLSGYQEMNTNDMDAPTTSVGGGSLPLGYYERQCQWDACGGPLPDRSQATRPTPQ